MERLRIILALADTRDHSSSGTGDIPVFLGRKPLSQACGHAPKVHHAARQRAGKVRERDFRVLSFTPSRHFTVTGHPRTAFIAVTQRATRSGVAMRQARKHPTEPDQTDSLHSG